MDYTAYQLKAQKKLQALGQRVVIKRLDTELCKTYGLVTQKSSGDDGSASMMNTFETVVILPGNLRTPPVVGDTLTLRAGTFVIDRLDEVNPDGAKPLIYKAVVV